MKILIVGAGLSGAVIARELAEFGGFEVCIIDKRNHIGGNTYDPIHPITGSRFHQYGPHIFHTNNKSIVDYLSQFTAWVPYKHKVGALLPNGLTAPMPINIDTLNLHYDLALADENAMRNFLNNVRQPIKKPANAEEHLHSIYGEELTTLFFTRYTKKMWDLELKEIPISVVARLPVRFDDNCNYFNDEFQMMPQDGYLNIFEKMLDHPRISVELSVEFEKSMEKGFDHIFNSMPIDDYFSQKFGALPYRSIKFEHRLDEQIPQSVPTVNFTDDDIYTRKSDWSLYPGCEGTALSLVTYEIPCSYEENNYERYYPLKTFDGVPQKLFKKYKQSAKSLEKVTFIGRCGQYIYYDMHQAVANSLTTVKQFLEDS